MFTQMNEYRQLHPITYAMGVGALAGTLETVIGLPTINIGNAMITRSQIPRTMSTLYRGWKAQFPTMIAFFGMVYFCNAALKEREQNREIRSALKWTSPAISGILGTAMMNPLDSVVMQMNKRKIESAWEMTQTIYKETGLVGFNRGLSACMCRNALYFTALLLASETFYHSRSFSINKSDQTTFKMDRISSFIFSSVAGGVVSILSQPFHVLSVHSKEDVAKPFSMFAASRNLMKKEGIKAFYKGSSPRLFRLSIGMPFVSMATNMLMNSKNKE